MIKSVTFRRLKSGGVGGLRLITWGEINLIKAAKRKKKCIKWWYKGTANKDRNSN